MENEWGEGGGEWGWWKQGISLKTTCTCSQTLWGQEFAGVCRGGIVLWTQQGIRHRFAIVNSISSQEIVWEMNFTPVLIFLPIVCFLLKRKLGGSGSSVTAILPIGLKHGILCDLLWLFSFCWMDVLHSRGFFVLFS